ncbi:hypothetical protein OROGR_008711 [Orobanche gracilis]
MAAVTDTVVRPVMAGVAVAKSQNFSRFLPKNSKTSSAIGSLASQLTGVRISTTQFLKTAPFPISAPFRPSLQPVVRRICPFTGKKSNKANKVSHSNHKTIKRQFVNLQYKRIWWVGSWKTLRQIAVVDKSYKDHREKWTRCGG